MLEGTAKSEEANSTEVTDDDDDFGLDIDDNFILEAEKEEKEEDFDYSDPEENPVSEVLTGLTNWWDNFSPFAPKPTTTQAPSTTQPDGDGDDDDDDYQDEYEEDADEDDFYDTTVRTTTTTTTTPVPFYTVPPARKFPEASYMSTPIKVTQRFILII